MKRYDDSCRDKRRGKKKDRKTGIEAELVFEGNENNARLTTCLLVYAVMGLESVWGVRVRIKNGVCSLCDSTLFDKSLD